MTAALAVPAPHPVHSRRGPSGEARTRLVALASAPFPYDGLVPETSKPFLDVVDEQGRRGRRTSRGRIYWEDETFNDRRVLLHIPPGFDVRRPGVVVVYFHGHGARIDDVAWRQQVPRQVSMSRANAVLVAPQLAVNAADSSVGKLWQPGAFAQFLDESAAHLAAIYGDQRAAKSFARMPVVVVAYSGGYAAAAWAAHHGGIGDRLRGVVLLDGLYGEIDKFVDWIGSDGSTFFVSAYTDSTRRHHERLKQALEERNFRYATALEPRLLPGMLALIDTGSDTSHRDFATMAWTAQPVSDVLSRLSAYRRR